MAISPVSGLSPQIAAQPLNQSPEVSRQEIETSETRQDQESPERNVGNANAQTQSNLQTDRTNQANAGADSQNRTNNPPATNLLSDIASANRVSANRAPTQNSTTQAQPNQNAGNAAELESPQETSNEPSAAESTETSSAINPASTRAQNEDINAQRLQNSLQAPRLGQGIDLNI